MLKCHLVWIANVKAAMSNVRDTVSQTVVHVQTFRRNHRRRNKNTICITWKRLPTFNLFCDNHFLVITVIVWFLPIKEVTLIPIQPFVRIKCKKHRVYRPCLTFAHIVWIIDPIRKFMFICKLKRLVCLIRLFTVV